MKEMLPESWRGVLGEETEKPYFKELTEFVEEERAEGPVYPPRDEVFAALDATPYDQVKVLILGQDPYHGAGQGARPVLLGAARACRTPPSLRNIYKEMQDELGLPVPDNGYLMPWARAGRAAAERGADGARGRGQLAQGQGLGEVHRRGHPRRRRPPRPGGVRAVGRLRARRSCRSSTPNGTWSSRGPTPRRCRRSGSSASRPFTQINEAVAAQGHAPIDWRIPHLG